MLEMPNIVERFSALSHDELMGLLIGIHSMPEFLQPSAWMGQVRAEEDGFADMEEAQAFFDALMGLYNRVGETLRESPLTVALYPELGDADAVTAFCRGYLRAIHLQSDKLDDDDPALVYLFLLSLLAGDVDAEEAWDPDESGFETVEEWLDDHRYALPGYVCELYERWTEERRKLPPTETVVRPGPKVGRNDSCPCGSGKKYKRCCLN